jgi:ATP-dependent Clp protease adaptor protein ClpS
MLCPALLFLFPVCGVWRFKNGPDYSVMSTAVVVPEIEEATLDKGQDEPQSLYHVILLDDNDHTYEYVIEMLMEIFGFSEQKAYEHTVEVDSKGHSRLTTCPLAEAEAKRDEVHAYGADWRLPRSAGSLAALIEPAA